MRMSLNSFHNCLRNLRLVRRRPPLNVLDVLEFLDFLAALVALDPLAAFGLAALVALGPLAADALARALSIISINASFENSRSQLLM